MQLSEEFKYHLITNELLSRQENEQKLLYRKQMIKDLLENHCELSSEACLSREEWQDFCFKYLTNRTCHANLPFSLYMNKLMPELGFPLGYAHKKMRVYRGLKWKT